MRFAGIPQLRYYSFKGTVICVFGRNSVCTTRTVTKAAQVPMPIRDALTKTEQKVAQLYADGASFSEIAASMTRSPHTVRSHLKSIYQKLGVNSKIALRKRISGAFGEVPVLELSETRDDWKLFQSALLAAVKCNEASQSEAKSIFCELRDKRPAFSGAHAGLSFISGSAAFAASTVSDASVLLDEAKEMAEISLSHNSFDGFAHMSMARASAFGGDIEIGEEHARFALDCDPSFAWAQYTLLFVLVHKGELQDAIQFGQSAREGMKSHAAFEPASLLLALAYLRGNEYDQASQLALSLLRRNQAHSLVSSVACCLLAEANRFSDIEAFARLEKRVFIAPTPVQHRLRMQDGATLDLMLKHRDRIEEMFC